MGWNMGSWISGTILDAGGKTLEAVCQITSKRFLVLNLGLKVTHFHPVADSFPGLTFPHSFGPLGYELYPKPSSRYRRARLGPSLLGPSWGFSFPLRKALRF